MKQYILRIILFYLAFFGNYAAAQTYQNEWIDYDKTYYKIKVLKNGLYRIPTSLLEANGIPIQAAGLKLYHNGAEVPLYLSTNGTMGANDYAEFYGERNNGTLDKLLYKQPGHQPFDSFSLFGDTSVYFLTWANQPNNARFISINNNLNNPPPRETHYWHTHRDTFPNAFYPGEPFHNLGGVNNNYAEYENCEGFCGTLLFEEQSLTYNIPLPGFYPDAGGTMRVRTRLAGRSDDFFHIPDHHLRITINGVYVEDTTFEGQENYVFKFNIPVQDFNTSTVNMVIQSLADISDVDKYSMVYNSVNYPRNFDFGNSRRNVFEVDNGDKYFEVSNFNGGTAPVLYDLSNYMRLIPEVTVIGGQTIHRFFLPNVVNGAAKRRLLLTSTDSPQTVFTVSNLTARQFTNFGNAAKQGNYIIISSSFLETGDVNHVARYANYRRSAEGGGYQVVLADINELYDQFAWGIEKHPLSIRHFVNYALDEWQTKPQFLLLLGKAVMYSKTRFNVDDYHACLVPTFGSGPSDNALSYQDDNTYHPQLAVGRIPARTPKQVGDYLDKIITYETDLLCTKEDLMWRKNAVHLIGGNNFAELSEFVQYMTRYKQIYEDSIFGGKVLTTYEKQSPSAIEFVGLEEYINKGLGMINFAGHSYGITWNIDIDEPENYTNFGKYPFMLSSTCFVGNIHDSPSTEVMPERWVLAEERGAIGFLSGVGFGFPPYLNVFMKRFYENFCRDQYGKTVGECIQRTIVEVDSLSHLSGFGLGTDGVKLTCQEYTLAADPALHLNTFEQPEFIIENTPGGTSDVFLDPPTITSNLDSFALKVVLYNAGASSSDSVWVRINRAFPNDSTATVVYQKVPVPAYADTLAFYITTGDVEIVAGDNFLTVEIDADNKYNEHCESNNAITLQTFIFSDILAPISPCNYAIVASANPTLYASTGQLNATAAPYILQLDTTELFNSPLKLENVLNSDAGVVKWTPPITLVPNRVYYWRTSQIPDDASTYNWQTFSFIHIPNSPIGWNQSHYYQFAHNRYFSMNLDSISRKWYYGHSEYYLNLQNNRNNSEQINNFLNTSTQLGYDTGLSQCPIYNTGGLAFIVMRPTYHPVTNEVSLLPMVSTQQNPDNSVCERRGIYGNYQYALGPTQTLEFPTNDDEQLSALLNFVQNIIKDDDYVVVYSIRNHQLANTSPTAPIAPYREALQTFFADRLGIPQINEVNDNRGFIAIGHVGFGDINAFATEENPAATFQLNHNLKASKRKGTMTSPPIGPALSWGTIELAYQYVEPNLPDSLGINVYGIAPNGAEALLQSILPAASTDISNINATQYPYIRLQWATQDMLRKTPPVMNHWRVLFERGGELALDPKTHYLFHADTLNEGDPMRLEIAVLNASGTPMDSVLVGYSVLNLETNTLYPINYPRQAPIGAFQTIIASFEYDTQGWGGDNILIVDVNPNNDQPEKFRFNNVLQIPFHIIADSINPILDVTFDGRHILDGDLVAAKPEILILAKDENRNLALNDTADFDIKFVYPDASEHEISFANTTEVTYLPANETQTANGNNEARVILRPNFVQDGVYMLQLTARDRSKNEFAPAKHEIRFEVQTKASVSNVLNYPNPFTSSTKFIFTLTGQEVPQNFKIQIMSVSGRVVRELTRADLGPIYVGRNVTDYAWDGTDQYGSPLANGVYLYRVSASNNDQKLDINPNEAIDGLFKNGWGKMYLMR